MTGVDLAIIFLVGVVNVLIGSIVLLHNTRRLINISFCLLACGIGSWIMSLSLLYITRNFIFNTYVFLSALPTFFGLTLFSRIFPANQKISWRFFLLFIPLAAVALNIPFNTLVRSIEIDHNGFVNPINGPAFPLFMFSAFGYLLISLYFFRDNFKTANERYRAQMLYVAVGIATLIASIIIFDIGLPAIGIYRLNLLGPLSSLVFVCLTGCAVVRHELMDIRIIIRHGLACVTMIALVVGMYLTVVGAMAFLFGTTAFTLFGSALLTVLAFAVATPLIARARLYREAERHTRTLEEKVAVRTAELKAAQEQQQQMILDISHGLQTPLTVFQTKLEGLKRTVLEDDDIRGLEQSVHDLSTYISDLLSLARLENVVGPVPVEVLNFSALVQDIVDEVTIVAEHNAVAVTSDIKAGLYIRGDAKQVREAILNLCSNAIKFMRDTERSIAFTLTTDARAASFSVFDTGIGVDAEDLPRIFERFYRTNKTRNIKGSGLGLAITKRIVERHGGTITAKSVFGKGTNITIRLPLAPKSHALFSS